MKEITLNEQLVISILNDWTFEHLNVKAPYISLETSRNVDGHPEVIAKIAIYDSREKQDQETIMERTVRIWIDESFIEFEVENDFESEDDLYEAVFEHVMDAITIQIVQENT